MKLNGASGFDHYYRTLYQDRWTALKSALINQSEKLQRPTLRGPAYAMDQASIIAAESLFIEPNDQVLDLCAAPGGKTLIFAEKLGAKGRLVANDLSRQRRLRLKKVIQTYLPKELQRKIEITGFDATRWCLFEKNQFDKIFIDAPCSSEAHVLSDQKELAKWSPSRSKRLSIQQFAILASALDLLKPGGTMVYCTCSISSLENDRVIEKLFKKRKGQFSIQSLSMQLGEPTQLGWQIFPDIDSMGPIYFSVIKKANEH